MNAAGRLGQPQLAVELLVTDRQDRAQELAEYIDQLNAHMAGEQLQTLAPLAGDANVDGISVHLESGVLTVNVPRCPPPPKPQPKRIPVSLCS